MKKRGLNLPGMRTVKGSASVWKRLAAFVFDLLLINLIVFYPFRGFMEKIMPAGSIKETYQFLINNAKLAGALSYVSAVMAVLAILYFALLEYKTGQTIGKILMRIYIVGDGKELRLWQCLARSMFLMPVFPFVLLWALDPLFMFFTANSQRLSEILSRTRTVEDFAV